MRDGSAQSGPREGGRGLNTRVIGEGGEGDSCSLKVLPTSRMPFGVLRFWFSETADDTYNG